MDTKTAQQAKDVINWFSRCGHWVYEYRAEAVRVLMERGINGRPKWTPELGEALKSWVAADPLPGIIARAA